MASQEETTKRRGGAAGSEEGEKGKERARMGRVKEEDEVNMVIFEKYNGKNLTKLTAVV